MSETVENLDGVGDSFALDDLKKKSRQWDVTSKPRNALAAIEREILREIASQSGRYGDRLDALLGEMAPLRRVIESVFAQRPFNGKEDAGRDEALHTDMARYNRLRAEAQQVQHYLIIHREAMDF